MNDVEQEDEGVKGALHEAHGSTAPIRAEVTLPGQADAKEIEVEDGPKALARVREELGLGVDTLLFERDGDAAITAVLPGRKAIRLVAHPARLITVKVQYEHTAKEGVFPPSKTVFKVLQWAVGKKGFDLDSTAAARANLILPGAEAPLPKDAVIGAYVEPGQTILIVDLTLRDFTNG